MSWTLLIGVVMACGVALLAVLSRRAELRRMRSTIGDLEEARAEGSDKAQLAHPVVDLSRCLGCGTCVSACPEKGILDLVHGQAVVVRGASCVGHGRCEAECPVGAITVTIADLAERRDIPVVEESLEAPHAPGLFLAGELTAHALIKRAVDQGTAAAAEVARRVAQTTASAPTNAPAMTSDAHAKSAQPVRAIEGGATMTAAPSRVDHACDRDPERPLDLVVVGAGPAGLACSLEAKRHGLDFITLEQEAEPGGTVAKYPRGKLVMTEPVTLPIYGRFKRTEYTKEELVRLWHRIAREQDLPIHGGVTLHGLSRDVEGHWLVRTNDGVRVARHVVLALGRRGTPNRLDIPGEDLPKVHTSLLDAHSHRNRKILVVGGGDSAVETAMGLAEQPGNEVILSYRKSSFFRVRTRNKERLAKYVDGGRLRLLFDSRPLAIHEDAVELEQRTERRTRRLRIPNDEVFVMAGGTPPFELLEHAGVSFDPAERPAPRPIEERGTGLAQALMIAFVLSLGALVFAVWHSDYYALPAADRPAHDKHVLLRPGLGLGLAFGFASLALILTNLLYLVRRSMHFGFKLGSLRAWMTSHVATGVLAFLFATLHGAMSPRATVGGHAFWALAALLATGAIGRYFYAWVPRAANGRELDLAEVKSRLGTSRKSASTGERRFVDYARREVDRLIDARQWKSSFIGRVIGLALGERELYRMLRRIRERGRHERVDAPQIKSAITLAKRAHRTSLMVAHYEDLRAVLSSWRYLHRWIAALMIALVAIHIVFALSYGSFFGGG